MNTKNEFQSVNLVLLTQQIKWYAKLELWFFRRIIRAQDILLISADLKKKRRLTNGCITEA